MILFNEVQVEDLRDLLEACRVRRIDVAIIGAMAYRVFVRDIDRTTRDIDLAVAIELNDLHAFHAVLASLGWTRVPRQEQRWSARRGTLVDILPAGPDLCAQGHIDWPESGLTMTMAVFDHIFREGVTVPIAGNLECKVIPPPVLALLKMGSYLHDPYSRAKDLTDLTRLLQRYEQDSDRIFSDEVFDAELPDIEFAAAYLLGRDIAAICMAADRSVMDRFLKRVEEMETRDGVEARRYLDAFRRGLTGDSGSSARA